LPGKVVTVFVDNLTTLITFFSRTKTVLPFLLRQREVCVSDSFTVQMSKVRYIGAHQRHTIRDRRPSTAACPACWTMGTKVLKKKTGEDGEQQRHIREKQYFVLDRLEQPRKNKNILHWHYKPNELFISSSLKFLKLAAEQLLAGQTVRWGWRNGLPITVQIASAGPL
jgi:hypothetical protein